mgnify:CR=1 FL=1
MIAVIDYGVGNLFSLKSSLAAIGQEAVVTRDQEELDRADHILLPGVGAFGDAVEKLRSTGMDRAVLRQAAAGKPLLGICRGAQVLNVAFGGTLWQDIPAQCRAAICHYQDSAARGELFHSLTLAPDSLLARIMGPGQHECNTFHHQAVRDVAPGFAAAAHAPDGLVEAVESADGLALGVQWHPENLAPEHPDHAAIFTWLVDAAAGGALLKR